MGRFARVIHHIDMKDVKRKHLEEIAAKKLKEERDKKEKELIKEISRKYKSDWKTELSEKMTTGAVFTTTVAPAEDDGTVTQISPIDAASFTPVKMPEHIGQEGGVGDDGVFDSAFVGTVIRDSGTGNGSDGGFNVGGQYLAFQGTGAPNNNARFASLGSIDSTKIDTLTITAIVGNDSNGGEDPDLQSECLFVLYKTPTMERAEGLELKFVPPYDGEGDGIIIKTPLDGQDGRGINNGGLNEYSIKIPDYARAKDTVFVLYQNFNSGSGYDNYGITDIKFQRKTPLNVVVPLDDPQAVSFIRVGTDEGDPKKRKKKLNDQLAASDEYTQSQLGDEFPGAGTRVGGDDPFASAKIGDDVEPSPIGKDEVTKSFTNFQQQIKSQNDEYLADLENLLVRNDYNYADPKIVQIADKILKTDPTNEDAFFYKLAQQYDSGDIEGAFKTTDAMIENNPDNTLGYEFRAQLRKEDGDFIGAIEDLEKAIELDPNEPYYQDMMTEFEGESDDDIESVLNNYSVKSQESLPQLASLDPKNYNLDGLTQSAIDLKWFDPHGPVNPANHYLARVNASNDALRAAYDAEFYGSLARGDSPNYNSSWIQKLKADRDQAQKELDGWIKFKDNNNWMYLGPNIGAIEEPEPDFNNVPKTSEKILADLEADIAKYSAEEQAAYAEMKRIALEFGLDVISLVGGLFTGGTSLAGSPSLSKVLLQLAKKSGKGLFGKLVRKILRKTQKKDVYDIDDIPDIPDMPDIPDTNIGPRPVPPKPKKDIPKDMEYNWNPTGGSDGRGQWEVRDIPPKPTPPKPKEPKFTNFDGTPIEPVDPSTIKRPDGKPFDPLPRETGYSLDPIVGGGCSSKKGKRKNKKRKPFRESTLFEKIKSKPFFNPKDIKPVFPENPPPQLDPKTGMHPNYGKTAKRYKKLDPISANAMPPTGDPETDAVVDKQRTKPKPKLFNKLKKHTRKGLTDK